MNRPSTSIEESTRRSGHAPPNSVPLSSEPPWPIELRRQHRSYHRGVLLAAVLVLVAAMGLERNDTGTLQLPGLRIRLPTLCWSRGVFGLECPGCGLTRAFVCIGHGDFSAAWRHNPAGLPMFVIVAAQIPWRLIQLTRIARGDLPLSGSRWSTSIIAGMLVLLFTQWMLKIAVR
ncbi:MAG: DUF2752 domain-containing protein [Planctomycetes bacterium]|nr:DUF2752 domain-containing protein [Planctomycetota bacterium]